MTPEVEIRPISTEETYPVRLRVLRPGRPPETAQFTEDADATHFGAAVDSEIVGVVTIFPRPLAGETTEAWQLRGMAVDATFRNRQIGALLLDACLAHAKAQGAEIIWCNARVEASNFYAKHGFLVRGELFQIPDVGPHYVMWKALT